VSVNKARVHVSMRNQQQGSVLQGTVKASCLGIETRLELESDDSPERVAAMVRNAENGCFTMQALLNPVQFNSTVTLNGSSLPIAKPGQ
jgi:organic hydroperoxide reductase OsmC/OhrA